MDTFFLSAYSTLGRLKLGFREGSPNDELPALSLALLCSTTSSPFTRDLPHTLLCAAVAAACFPVVQDAFDNLRCAASLLGLR